MNSFDSETGTYRIGGRPVPRVTRVLGDLIPGWQAGEWYLQRGRAVHECATLIAQGLEFGHDPAIDGQVRACRRFFAEVKPEVLAVEQRVYSATYGYAGTLDLLCKIGGKRVVLDWKSCATTSAPLQLAAYGLACSPVVTQGCAVILHDNGRYTMTKLHDLRRLGREWLALLTAYQVRRRYGIPEQGREE